MRDEHTINGSADMTLLLYMHLWRMCVSVSVNAVKNEWEVNNYANVTCNIA